MHLEFWRQLDHLWSMQEWRCWEVGNVLERPLSMIFERPQSGVRSPTTGERKVWRMAALSSCLNRCFTKQKSQTSWVTGALSHLPYSASNHIFLVQRLTNNYCKILIFATFLVLRNHICRPYHNTDHLPVIYTQWTQAERLAHIEGQPQCLSLGIMWVLMLKT